MLSAGLYSRQTAHKTRLLGYSGTLRRAGTRRHIEEIVAHAMLELSFMQRMVVNHHHFIVICLGDWESLAVFVDLMGEEFTERPVSLHVRYSSQESLFLRFILQCNQKQFIVAMRIRVFDAAVHTKL